MAGQKRFYTPYQKAKERKKDKDKAKEKAKAKKALHTAAQAQVLGIIALALCMYPTMAEAWPCEQQVMPEHSLMYLHGSELSGRTASADQLPNTYFSNACSKTCRSHSMSVSVFVASSSASIAMRAGGCT